MHCPVRGVGGRGGVSLPHAGIQFGLRAARHAHAAPGTDSAGGRPRPLRGHARSDRLCGAAPQIARDGARGGGLFCRVFRVLSQGLRLLRRFDSERAQRLYRRWRACSACCCGVLRPASPCRAVFRAHLLRCGVPARRGPGTLRRAPGAGAAPGRNRAGDACARISGHHGRGHCHGLRLLGLPLRPIHRVLPAGWQF